LGHELWAHPIQLGHAYDPNKGAGLSPERIFSSIEARKQSRALELFNDSPGSMPISAT
jgi:hypothetical protein